MEVKTRVLLLIVLIVYKVASKNFGRNFFVKYLDTAEYSTGF